MEAAEATSQPELDGLIAAMDKEQLVASLQHMALQWRTLQGDITAPVPSGRYPSDNPTRLVTAEDTAEVTALTPRGQRYRARERVDSPPPPVEQGTLEPKREPAVLEPPAAVQQLPTTGTEITDEQKSRMNKEGNPLPSWNGTGDRELRWSLSSRNSRLMLNIFNGRKKIEFFS